MKRAMEEIEQVISTLQKDTDCKINFVVALQMDDGEHHVQQVRVDASNDHHFLDLLSGIHETWWKGNHKEMKTCATS